MKQIAAPLAADYAPYHTMPAFQFGFDDYQDGDNAAAGFHGAAGQAYDRGREFAMRCNRWASRPQLSSAQVATLETVIEALTDSEIDAGGDMAAIEGAIAGARRADAIGERAMEAIERALKDDGVVS
jgi:hypothetical protein